MSPIPKLALLMASLLLASPALAEVEAEHPFAVQTFLDTCVSGELSASSRVAAIEAGGWTELASPTLDVPKFGISKAIDRNYDFSKPVSTRQWAKEINGVQVQALLATFPEKRRHQTLCAIVLPNEKGAWPYDDAFEAGVKAIGLKGKSTDLPHYFEYSGKLGADKRPVRAEIFSRTQASAEKNSMHLYIAF
jgi:hypothetical protein